MGTKLVVDKKHSKTFDDKAGKTTSYFIGMFG